MNDVDKAEEKAKIRATLFYLMAVALVMSAWTGLGRLASLDRVIVWLVMVTLIALNLSPLATMLSRKSWAPLLNDESTQDHRRTSATAGFWAAIAAAAAMAGLAAVRPIAGFDVSRVVITAGLTAALISFATLELRAARG